MLDELTNESKYLLTSMYKEYLKRRKSGMDRPHSRQFGGETMIHDEIMPEWQLLDVHDSIFELRTNKLVETTNGSDTFIIVVLSPKAIAELEITFKDHVDKVLDYAAKIKSAIPFI